ncbi:MAG: prolipoprotein diacylglyceryl transferase [Verrucomicrobiota bacterium]|nr:prolipoprotein diacylglyceryl transferase [Verrucomicrobiota bacterium]
MTLPPCSLDAFTPLAYWVHNLSPDIIRFTDKLAIRWYGLAYIMGFIVAAVLLRLYYKRGRSPVTPEQSESLMIAMVLGVFIGGRLGYMLLYDLPAFLSNPLLFFRFWEGGMASHGGFIGVLIAVIWFTRSAKVPFLRLADIIVTLAPPGLFFGRIANFINGELWGRVTTEPWAVLFPGSPMVDKAPAVFVESLGTFINPRHPSQIYEAALEGLLLFIYTQWRFWRRNPAKACNGQLAGEFLIGYALVRIFCEYFREPDADLIAGLSRGSFYSIFFVVAGTGIIVFARARRNTKQ